MSIGLNLGLSLQEPCPPYTKLQISGVPRGTVVWPKWDCIPYIPNPVTALDLSAIPHDSEAIIAAIQVVPARIGVYNFDFKWFRDRDQTLLFEWIDHETVTGNQSIITASWIGYLDGEISEDGSYHVTVDVSGPETQVLDAAFLVTGISQAPSLIDLPGQILAWFQNLANTVLGWFTDAKNYIVSTLTPFFTNIFDWINGAITSITSNLSGAITAVYDWIQSAISSIVSGVGALFNQVYDWISTSSTVLSDLMDYLKTDVLNGFQALQASLNDVSGFVASQVQTINAWFSNEFIDPFIDWLVQFPGQFTGALLGLVNGLASRLESWLSHQSPGFPGILWGWLQYVYNSIVNASQWVTGADPSQPGFDPNKAIWSLLGLGLGEIAATFVHFLSAAPAVGGALSELGTWIELYAEQFGLWILRILAKSLGLPAAAAAGIGAFFTALLQGVVGWFAQKWIPLLGGSALLGLEVTGKLQPIIDNIVSPAIAGIVDWAESQGPVAPVAGAAMGQGITKLATFTIGGLAGLTLAGETLSPLKHIGLGQISAIVYDLINYKTLTAAFMGVLAAVYIRQPLTYYYNQIARPVIPGENELRTLYADQEISLSDYVNYMGFHGYPDSWIAHMSNIAYRPLSAFLLSSLITAGVMQDVDIDELVRLQGYGPEVGGIIKAYANRSKTAAAKALSSSVAISSFRAGLDDDNALLANLGTLGYDDAESQRLLISAQMGYIYDYRSDLLAYYTDAYHRNDIQADELRSDLASLGVVPDRIDLIIQAQSIKRLKAAAPTADPAIAVEEATIREQRTKSLITETQESAALVALGIESSLALAYAKQDTVKLAKAGTVVAAVTTPDYETEAGKTQTDTIRRLRRAGQETEVEELNALLSLAMPQELAQAIVDNDTVRMTKSSTASTGG